MAQGSLFLLHQDERCRHIFPPNPGSESSAFSRRFLDRKHGKYHNRYQSRQKNLGNPIITSHDPQAQPTLYGSVIYNPENGYRIWYSTRVDGVKRMFVFHQKSDDGIHWEKPSYDLIKINGKSSHAVFGTDTAPHMTELSTVLYDPHDKDPDRRYKLLFKHREPGLPSPFKEIIMQPYQQLLEDLRSRGMHDLVETYHRVISDALFLPTQRRAMGTTFSSDGIHWNQVNPLAIPQIGDISHLTWDSRRNRYLILARDFYLPEDVHEKFKHQEWYRKIFWGRAVRLYESEDFNHWEARDIVMHADLEDLPGDEIYSMAVFPYEGLYLGLVQIYHAYPGNNTVEIQLAVSRDCLQWKRLGNRQTFITLGGIGQWDRFNNSVASAPVLLDDEIRFYYSGRSYRHKPYAEDDSGPLRSAIGFASIKRDRFVGCGASFDGGAITTKPMLIKGANLRLNAASAHGSIIVSILDQNGQPIEGMISKPVQMDSLNIPVQWPKPNENLERLTLDKPIMLRFELKNAKLYSFWAA